MINYDLVGEHRPTPPSGHYFGPGVDHPVANTPHPGATPHHPDATPQNPHNSGSTRPDAHDHGHHSGKEHVGAGNTEGKDQYTPPKDNHPASTEHHAAGSQPHHASTVDVGQAQIEQPADLVSDVEVSSTEYADGSVDSHLHAEVTAEDGSEFTVDIDQYVDADGSTYTEFSVSEQDGEEFSPSQQESGGDSGYGDLPDAA
jgi:hypothetical protein